MKLLSKISIQEKIALIVLGISFFTLSTGFLFMLRNMNKDLKENLEANAQKNAELVGEYSIVPLAFTDNFQAEKNMEVLKKVPGVEKAILYTADTVVFATYRKENSETSIQPEFYKNNSFYKDGYYYVFHNIIKDNMEYGTIMLQFSTQTLTNETKRNVVIFTILLAILLFISYTLASILQKFISQPVLKLVNVMKQITSEHDYSTRVTKSSDDEIGELYDGFNAMIEEIHKAQTKIQSSEAKFKNYIQSAPDGIFVLDEQNNIIDVNRAALSMTGMSKRRLLNNNVNDFVALKDNQKLGGFHKQSFDIVYKPNDGSRHDWSVSIVKLENNNILVFAKDISKRKLVEREIKNLRNYLSNIIDSMPSVIVGVDHRCFVTQWNKETEKYTGIKNNYALGKPLTEVFPGIEKDMNHIQKSINTRKIVKKTKSIRTINETEHHENITIYPLVANDELGAVIRVDDITELVRMEEMMIQSEKMLSVGGLAAGMAHEIQNANLLFSRVSSKLPANVKAAEELGTTMDTIAAYMEKRNIPKQLQLIKESGERAARIVNNMLSFSRKSESNSIPVDVADVLNKTLELAENDYTLKKSYDFRNIKLVKQYEKVNKVICDESKIQQVFLNILKNGAEAMYESDKTGFEPTFVFTIKQSTKFVKVIIEDNGPGMDPNTKKRIFEPFYTTKAVGKGSGLGLSLSYFIITENHNGEMQVESELGVGTKFIIKLPI